jgi:hypothetical protein
MRKPKKQRKKPINDLSSSLTPFDANRSSIAVFDMGHRSWLVAGIIPGIDASL